MQWENVHIFISSTFNDMHAERDYLVKSVFPALSEWCEERKLRLIDIDLRWGVTAADSEAKNTVRACLRNIDECRPFFLCFLGQRRGWVPAAADIGPDTYELFPKLQEKHYVGESSVTEMEILHALIDPLHNGILRRTKDDTRSGQAAEHAFFYLRDPGYLKDIPHPDLRAIYTNEAERDIKTADAELTRWREQEIPRTNRPVHAYTAAWQTTESTPEIALPLCVPTTAPKDSQAWKNAYAAWKNRWLTAGVTVNENGEITGAELEKAKTYNKTLTRGRLGNFRSNDRPLAEIIIDQLKTAIAARYPEHMTIAAQTPLQKELDQQAQFLRIASEGFIERAGDFDALNDYLKNETESRPFAVTANAGMGKTSFLAHFIDTYSPQNGETLHYRFIGGSDDSVSVERLLRSLLLELKQAGKISSDIPAASAEMMNKLPELLAEAGKKGKTVLIIDALNQLETGMDDLYWISDTLPQNIKLIVSFKCGGKSAENYYLQQKESGSMILHSIKPFENKDDRKALVAAYLEQYFKELDEPRIQSLISADGAGNPLFLKAALSELRVFGVHNDLSEVIRTRFGNTPVKAFDAILSRMETDPAHATLTPATVLPRVFGWLAHSRFGLSVEELTGLLMRERLTDKNAEAQDAVYLILRQLRAFLARRDGRVDFFYESFKIAAIERYTGSHPLARAPQKWHQSLAEYFETRPLENRHKLMEQAWQYAHAGMGAQLKALLWDFRFMRERLKTGIDAVINDYELILFPENGMSSYDVRNLRMLLKFFSITPHVFTQCPDQLTPRLYSTFSEETFCEEIPLLLEQIKRETKTPWLKCEKNIFPSLKTRLITISKIPASVPFYSRVIPVKDILVTLASETTGSYHMTVSLFRLDELKHVKTFTYLDLSPTLLLALSRDSEHIAFSVDTAHAFTDPTRGTGKWYTAGGIRMVNLKTGEMTSCQLAPPFQNQHYYSSDFSPDRKELFIYCGLSSSPSESRPRDNCIIRHSIDTGFTTKLLDTDKRDSPQSKWTLALGASSTEFYYTSSKGFHRYDMTNGETELLYEGTVSGFSLSPDRQTAYFDTGYILNLRDNSGYLLAESRGRLIINEAGTICALRPWQSAKSIELWDIVTRKKIGAVNIDANPYHIMENRLLAAGNWTSVYDISEPFLKNEATEVYACKDHIETVRIETIRERPPSIKNLYWDQIRNGAPPGRRICASPDRKYIIPNSRYFYGGCLCKLFPDGIYRVIKELGGGTTFVFHPGSKILFTIERIMGPRGQSSHGKIIDLETNTILREGILGIGGHNVYYIDNRNIVMALRNSISIYDTEDQFRLISRWIIQDKTNEQRCLWISDMFPFGENWIMRCGNQEDKVYKTLLLDLNEGRVLRNIETCSLMGVGDIPMNGHLAFISGGGVSVWDMAGEEPIAKLLGMNVPIHYITTKNNMIIGFDEDGGPGHNSVVLTLENAPAAREIREPSEAASRISLVALETDNPA